MASSARGTASTCGPQSYGVGESSADAWRRREPTLHALVPSLKALNSARSNRAFAQITDWPNDDARCGPQFPGCETPACTKTTCGVRDGAVGNGPGFLDPSGAVSRVHRARVVLHGGAVRRGRAEHAKPDAGGDAREGVGGGGPGGKAYVFGALSHLLRWHDDHPVEAWERARNDAVCLVQGNRNPFTDKPELAAVVFSNGSGHWLSADASDAGRSFDYVGRGPRDGPGGDVGAVHLRHVQVVRVSAFNIGEARC